MNIVWFKRDLRAEDHAALTQAAARGPVLPLYIFEPQLWQQPDVSARQFAFLKSSLEALDAQLTQLGQRLIVKTGNAVDVLDQLSARYDVQALWSHQETWNGWSYARDKVVKTWALKRGIPWYEPVQNGVIRGLRSRDGWAARWYQMMQQPCLPTPKNLPQITDAPSHWPKASELGLPPSAPAWQAGGRPAGIQLLNSFLHERGEDYSKDMSSPVTAFQSCSLLSAHIAFGTVSIREVFQACETRAREVKQMPRGMKGKWPSAMRSFSGRLRWHCHFIQKLEDEPRIEYRNMHPLYDGVRADDVNENIFQSWATGKTGYPMVDASMRALIATGWLNFRMRAMLVSFASYHLWLHWRRTALHLATLFTDYEPGIHYSQVQMQSGTTGINAIRIYNPIKQGIDQDPNGVFIRQWIPELREMDLEHLHTPWRAQSQMNGYPMPIVDEQTARKSAADRIYQLRRSSGEHKRIAQTIVRKHASRKPLRPKKTATRRQNHAQGELPL